MAIDGEIDYSSYSQSQLDYVERAIDKAAFPLNYQRLLAERERRKKAAGSGSTLGFDPALVDALGNPSQQTPSAAIIKPEFHGAGREYFRIWIINLALTLVTLGIYSPWAKVRKLRYIYGSTSFAGNAFGYHGDPRAILKGRLIAVLLAGSYFAAAKVSLIATAIIAIVVALAAPWLIVKSRQFALRMTSWRGIRFGFHDDYRGAYKVLIGWLIAGIVTFGILMPRVILERYKFLISRSRFGGAAFSCEPGTERFYITMFGVFGLSLALGLAATLLGAVVMAVFPALSLKIAFQIGTVAFYAGAFSLINGYVQSRNLNEVYGHTLLGPHRFHSQLSARDLGRIYLLNIVRVVFTLGIYTPWAQLNLIRYRLSCIGLEVNGSLDEFVAGAAASAPSAAGGEISNILDLDFGL